MTIIDRRTKAPASTSLYGQVGEWEPTEDGRFRAEFENRRNGRRFHNYKTARDFFVVHGKRGENQMPCEKCAAWVDVEVGDVHAHARGGFTTTIVCSQCNSVLDLVVELPKFLQRPETTFPRGARKSKNEHYTSR